MNIFFYTLLSWIFSTQYIFAEEYRLELPSFTQSGDPASLVNNFYLYVLGIAGTLAVIMIVFGGVKYITMAGNVSAQGDAKDIIKSAVWGLILLAGAFLVLNTINPSLVELKNPGLVQQELPDDEFNPVTVADGGSPTSTVLLAQEYLALNPSLDSNSTCAYIPAYPNAMSTWVYAAAKWVVRDIAEYRALPFVCAPNCSICQRGGASQNVTLSDSLLNVLIDLQKEVNAGNLSGVRITSLTGGPHRSGSAHYSGRAADLVVFGSNGDKWNEVLTFVKQSSTAFCEYREVLERDANDSNKILRAQNYITDDCNDMFDGRDIYNRHIHLEV